MLGWSEGVSEVWMIKFILGRHFLFPTDSEGFQSVLLGCPGHHPGRTPRGELLGSSGGGRVFSTKQSR